LQESVLWLGLDFVPSPPSSFNQCYYLSSPITDIEERLSSYARSIRIQYYYSHPKQPKPVSSLSSTSSSSSSSSASSSSTSIWPPKMPLQEEQALETRLSIIRSQLYDQYHNQQQQQHQHHMKSNIKSNISRSQLQALYELRTHADIIIKPADKNLGPVVMDRSWYEDECMRQLNDRFDS